MHPEPHEWELRCLKLESLPPAWCFRVSSQAALTSTGEQEGRTAEMTADKGSEQWMDENSKGRSGGRNNKDGVGRGEVGGREGSDGRWEQWRSSLLMHSVGLPWLCLLTWDDSLFWYVFLFLCDSLQELSPTYTPTYFGGASSKKSSKTRQKSWDLLCTEWLSKAMNHIIGDS